MKKSKTIAESASYLAEIVGQENQKGQRISAGQVLHMMDLAAASAAWKHSESSVVTIAFDQVVLLNAICHMDYFRLNASVIKVGRSSMLVKLDGYIKLPTEMDLQHTHSGLITVVAIDENRKPNRNIPGLAYETDEDELKTFAEKREIAQNERKKYLEKIDKIESVHENQLKDPFPRKHRLSPSKTILMAKKIFLPKNANFLGSVFAGDIIQLMEELAIANARQFTANFDMVTIVMQDILFLKPMPLNSVIEIESIVTFVRHHTMVVEVTVKAFDAIHRDKEATTNTGIFTILNFDRTGRKKEISVGLDMSQASQEEMKKYLKEQARYEKDIN